MKLAAVLLTVILASLLPTSIRASNGFLYNDNAECSIPFVEASVVSLDCQRPQGQYYQQQYGQEDSNGEDTPEACYFGDEMMVWGSFELSQKVNRYFSAIFEVCYYGSSYNAFYNPERCKTYRRSIDMRKYALMESENGDEYEEEEQEGYNYQSYWQDEERQQRYEERQQAMQEQAEAEETYLYAGSYSFTAYFKVPQKSFAFNNGSELRVKLKLVPRESYTMRYYSEQGDYASGIKDSRYQTECYLSFGAIPVNLYSRVFSDYYEYAMACVGFLLVGTATYVSSRRLIVCTCDGEEDDHFEVQEQHSYQKHIELAKSSGTVSTL